MTDAALTRRAKDQPSSNTPRKVKASRKRTRTRTDCDASFAESVDIEKDATQLKPRKNKKRDEDRTPHRLPYPDPTTDESLSEQSRRALSYAYGRWRKVENWKFNKARQNWLLHNVWSEQAVPGNDIPLVIEYLAGIRGGAREKLVAECTWKLSVNTLTASAQAQLLGDSTSVASASTIIQQPSTSESRTLSILHALHESVASMNSTDSTA